MGIGGRWPSKGWWTSFRTWWTWRKEEEKGEGKKIHNKYLLVDHFLILKSWKELIASCVGFEAIVA